MYCVEYKKMKFAVVCLWLLLHAFFLPIAGATLPFLTPPWERRVLFPLFNTQTQTNTDHQCILKSFQSSQNKIFCYSSSSDLFPLSLFSERGFLDIQQQPQTISKSLLPSQLIYALSPHTVFSIVVATIQNKTEYWTRNLFQASFSDNHGDTVLNALSVPLEYAGGSFQSLTAFSVHARLQQVYILLIDRQAHLPQANIFYIANNAWITSIAFVNYTWANQDPIQKVSLQVSDKHIAFIAQSAIQTTQFCFMFAAYSLKDSLHKDQNIRNIHTELFHSIELDINALNPVAANQTHERQITAFTLLSIDAYYQIWIAQETPNVLYQIEFPSESLLTWLENKVNASENTATNLFWTTYTNIMSFTMSYPLHQITLSHSIGIIIGENLDKNTDNVMALTNQMFRPNIPILMYDKVFCGNQRTQYSFNPCSAGYIAHHHHSQSSNDSKLFCIPSPKGGYSYLSKFIRCPPGTFNPNTGSTHPEVCKKCPEGFATFSSTIMCSACNKTHTQQSEDGSACLIPSSNQTQNNNNSVKTIINETLESHSQNPLLLPYNILSDFRIQIGIETSGIWTNEITAIAAFQNGTVLVATHSILTEINFKSQMKQRSISLAGQHQTFLPHNIQSIQTMLVASSEETIFAADPLAGIILRINQWDFYNPALSIRYLCVDSSITPTSLAHDHWTDTLFFLSSEQLYYTRNASNSVHSLAKPCYSALAVPQLLELPKINFITVPQIKTNDIAYQELYIVIDNSIWLWTTVISSLEFQNSSFVKLWTSSDNYTISHLYEILPFSFVMGYVQTQTLMHLHLANQTFSQHKYNNPKIDNWTISAMVNNIATSSNTHATNNNNTHVHIPFKGGSPIQKDSGMLIYAWSTERTTDIQIIYQRPFECSAGFYFAPDAQTCMPCTPHSTTSMTGAGGCTACPLGFYRSDKTMDLQSGCVQCPGQYWWVKDHFPTPQTTDNSEISACRPLMLRDMANSGQQPLMHALDDIQNALPPQHHRENWILRTSYASSQSYEDLVTNPYQWDLLGKFWQTKILFFDNNPNIASIQQFRSPGLWMPCLTPDLLEQNTSSMPQNCNCTVTSLLFKSSWGEPWDSIRIAAKQWKNPNSENIATEMPVFLLRMHTETSHNKQHARMLLLPTSSDSTFVNLASNYTTTDTGSCWIGWPPTYHCMDPNYYFDFDTLECTRCPNGTLAPLPSSIQCSNLTNTSNSTFWCPPGTYAYYASMENDKHKVNHTCMSCPKNTYSPKSQSLSCTQKTVRCPNGYYLQETNSNIEDHKCILCKPCDPLTTIMFPYDWQVNRLRCDGMITRQPYACVPITNSMSGFSMAVVQYNIFTYTNLFYLCTTSFSSLSPSLQLYYQWAKGTYPDLCYMQCKYGIHTPSLHSYYETFKLHAGEQHLHKWDLERDAQNLIPMLNPTTASKQQSNMLVLQERLSTVCSPCDLSQCPELMWRPLYRDGCGAPCFLSPSLCSPNRTDGCVALCDLPMNSKFLAYFKENSTCTWECKRGWFLDDNKTGCIQCSSTRLCPLGTSYVGDSQCLPHMSFSQVCPGCINESHLLPAGLVLSANQSEAGKCTYECYQEGVLFFKNHNPLTNVSMPCLPCRNLSSPEYFCPRGQMPSACTIEPCIPCPHAHLVANDNFLIPSYSYAIFSSSLLQNEINQNKCRIQCDAFHNTINLTNHEVIQSPSIANPQGYNHEEVECQPCSNRQGVSCTAVRICDAPNTTLSITQEEQCESCKDAFQLNCRASTFAPPCIGGRSMQPACVLCPLLQPPFFYVSYQSAQHNLLQNGGGGVYTLIAQQPTLFWEKLSAGKSSIPWVCPVACPANTVLVNQSTCIHCNLLYPKPPSNYPYSQYFTLWNASRARRWWEPAFDPPHLGPRFYHPSNGQLVNENRAGVCWPCPPSTSLSSTTQQPTTGSHILCSNDESATAPAPAPSPTPAPQISQSQSTGLNSLENLVAVQINAAAKGQQSRRPIAVNTKTRKRRRLLSIPSSEYEIELHNSIEWLQRTKTTALVIQNGSLTVLSCPEGYYQAPPFGYWCEACPSNYDCPSGSLHLIPISTQKVPETTDKPILSWYYHMKVYRKCPPGFYRHSSLASTLDPDLSQQPCIPCPSGSYEYQDICYPCPPFATSKAGQTQCHCDSLLHEAIYETVYFSQNGARNKLSSEHDWLETRLVECRPRAPPLQQKHQMCIHTANAVYDELRGDCVCPPGTQFFDFRIRGKVCMPCLKGFFSAKFGVGPCTQCPPAASNGQTSATQIVRDSLASCYANEQ